MAPLKLSMNGRLNSISSISPITQIFITMTNKLLSLTLLLILCVQANLFAQVSEAEKSALIELYKTTNGDSWTHTWNLNAPVDDWYGVEVLNKQVVGLILYENNLSGTLPASIKNLKNLEVLDLAVNSLKGELPIELTELSRIKVLRLELNTFSGTLPENIGSMKKMEQFVAYGNKLEGSLPASIADMKNLNILNLSHNALSGNLPLSMAFMGSLKELNLSGNAFGGEVGFSFERLKNLSHLSLSSNQFEGKVPAGISSLPELQLLQLQENQFGSFDNIQEMQSVYIEDFETDDMRLNLKHRESFDIQYRMANTHFEGNDR